MIDRNTNYNRKEIYDPLVGDWIREIKESDVWHLSTSGSTSVAAGTTLVSGTTDSNTQAWIHAIYCNGGTIYVTVGTSTVLAISNDKITSSKPLVRVPPSTTVSIVAETAGTYCAWLSAIREPIYSKVEI